VKKGDMGRERENIERGREVKEREKRRKGEKGG